MSNNRQSLKGPTHPSKSTPKIQVNEQKILNNDNVDNEMAQLANTKV